MKKIDYKSKTDIMVGYIDPCQNIIAVESGWKTTPEEMAKFLDREYPTKDDSIKVVDSPVLVPTYRREDYWGVEGFGDVIESHINFRKEVERKNVGHLFCHMTGVWKYSDNGVDWTPIREEFAETFKEAA